MKKVRVTLSTVVLLDDKAFENNFTKTSDGFYTNTTPMIYQIVKRDAFTNEILVPIFDSDWLVDNADFEAKFTLVDSEWTPPISTTIWTQSQST